MKVATQQVDREEGSRFWRECRKGDCLSEGRGGYGRWTHPEWKRQTRRERGEAGKMKGKGKSGKKETELESDNIVIVQLLSPV